MRIHLCLHIDLPTEKETEKKTTENKIKAHPYKSIFNWFLLYSPDHRQAIPSYSLYAFSRFFFSVVGLCVTFNSLTMIFYPFNRYRFLHLLKFRLPFRNYNYYYAFQFIFFSSTDKCITLWFLFIFCLLLESIEWHRIQIWWMIDENLPKLMP